jgi:hypothetical protein
MPNNELGNDNTVAVSVTVRLFVLEMVKIENVYSLLIYKMYMRKVRFNELKFCLWFCMSAKLGL